MRDSLLILSIAGAIAACASNPAASGQRCTLVAADSVYLKSGPVYRDCAVDHPAVLVDRSTHPDFRPPSPPPVGHACYSAELQFVVDTAGRPETETATVLRSNNPDFGVAALAASARWRYRPATIQSVPVRQIVREKEGMAVEVVVAPMGQPPRPGRPPMC